jgi:hypothetical protein
VPEPSLQLGFCLLACGLGTNSLYEFLQRLNLIGTQYDRLCHQVLKLNSMHTFLEKPGLTRSELYMALRDYSNVAIMACLLNTSSRRTGYRLRLYLEKLRNVKPLLNGSSLSELGIKNGPETGRILQELVKARLDGKTRTVQDEIRLVRELASGLTEHGKKPHR